MVRFSRKQKQLLVIAVAGLLASVAVVLLCVPVARIDQSATNHIRPGMTVGEAEALIGGAPGWYDGVWGIQTDAPAYKEYKPFWVGSQGEIILERDEQGRVAEAKFYPGQVLNRSVSKLVWERLTRSAFGTGRTDLVIEACNGIVVGLLVTCPLVAAAVLWRRQGGVGGPHSLCLLGSIVSLALLGMAIGLGSGTYGHVPFFLLGASATGSVSFAVGSIVTGKRKRAEPGPAPDRSRITPSPSS
jgi:hypothetical protein